MRSKPCDCLRARARCFQTRCDPHTRTAFEICGRCRDDTRLRAREDIDHVAWRPVRCPLAAGDGDVRPDDPRSGRCRRGFAGPPRPSRRGRRGPAPAPIPCCGRPGRPARSGTDGAWTARGSRLRRGVRWTRRAPEKDGVEYIGRATRPPRRRASGQTSARTCAAAPSASRSGIYPPSSTPTIGVSGNRSRRRCVRSA